MVSILMEKSGMSLYIQSFVILQLVHLLRKFKAPLGTMVVTNVFKTVSGWGK